jgi:hypothetical protein
LTGGRTVKVRDPPLPLKKVPNVPKRGGGVDALAIAPESTCDVDLAESERSEDARRRDYRTDDA